MLITGSGLAGAFESRTLFQTSYLLNLGGYPAALGHPLFLPDQKFWLNAGTGTPMGLDWAAHRTLSIGGVHRAWAGVGTAWTSGDELYNESLLAMAGTRKLSSALEVGLSLGYAHIQAKGYGRLGTEYFYGLAVAAALTENITMVFSYTGLPVDKNNAFASLNRQHFSLVLLARETEPVQWAVSLEKTPQFPIRISGELAIRIGTSIRLQAGYRSKPNQPSAGAVVKMGRLGASVQIVYDPILGLSTAYGLSIH